MQVPAIASGQSGYFSAPSNALDPRLFHGDQIRHEVRTWILNTLYHYWTQHYARPLYWSRVWLAGSGISYQWNADRGNGDLDVLIGVDWVQFRRFNPGYAGLSDADVADQINEQLHRDLWPQTAHARIATQGPVDGPTKGLFWGEFEVTFYVNATGSDIRDIHPYAAYELGPEQWTVRPPVLPHDPRTLYPQEWWTHINDERHLAELLLKRHAQLQGAQAVQQRGTPGWVTTGRQLGIVGDQIVAMFNDIHGGRRTAFSEQGEGYGDFNNFRWQAHKKYGTAQALHDVVDARKSGRTEYETETYGQPLTSAQQALRDAALYRRTR